VSWQRPDPFGAPAFSGRGLSRFRSPTHRTHLTVVGRWVSDPGPNPVGSKQRLVSLGWSRFWRPGSHGQSQPNKDHEGHKGSHKQVSDLLYASSPSPRLAFPATWCRTAKLACCASAQNGRRPDSRGALKLPGRGHCAGPPTGPGRRDLCSRDVEKLPYRSPYPGSRTGGCSAVDRTRCWAEL
jgi:hypothetical protein